MRRVLKYINRIFNLFYVVWMFWYAAAWDFPEELLLKKIITIVTMTALAVFVSIFILCTFPILLHIFAEELDEIRDEK